MRLNCLLAAAAVMTISTCTYAQTPAVAAPADITGPNKDLVQVSTINALIQGVYDGDVSFGELRKQADFGIGTFDYLDGEMVALDGEVFQVKGDGTVHPVADDVETPFASMTKFEADTTTPGLAAASYDDLKALINAGLPSDNLFYAVKILGSYPTMNVRSVKRQARPFRLLTEVVEDQAQFEFKDTSGTLVGFICPQWVQGVNVAGYHLHYISNDRTQGGHVLEFELAEGAIEIDYLNDFRMILPQSPQYLGLDLSDQGDAAIHKVEKLVIDPAADRK